MDLSAFLAENAERRDSKKIAISKRFKDKDGNPIEWEIRPLTAEEDDSIKKNCTRKVPVTGKHGRYTEEFDTYAYIAKMTARAVVFPSLTDSKLQDSYSVSTPEQLLTKMLYKDEFDALSSAVAELNQKEDINDLVEEAKN